MTWDCDFFGGASLWQMTWYWCFGACVLPECQVICLEYNTITSPTVPGSLSLSKTAGQLGEACHWPRGVRSLNNKDASLLILDPQS